MDFKYKKVWDDPHTPRNKSLKRYIYSKSWKIMKTHVFLTFSFVFWVINWRATHFRLRFWRICELYVKTSVRRPAHTLKQVPETIYLLKIIKKSSFLRFFCNVSVVKTRGCGVYITWRLNMDEHIGKRAKWRKNTLLWVFFMKYWNHMKILERSVRSLKWDIKSWSELMIMLI